MLSKKQFFLVIGFALFIILLATNFSWPIGKVMTSLQDEIIEQTEVGEVSLQNKPSEQIESNEEVSSSETGDISLFQDELTLEETDFLSETLATSERNPLYKALKTLRLEGRDASIRKALEAYPQFISSFSGEELYRRVDELYRARDLFPQGFQDLLPVRIDVDYPILYKHVEKIDPVSGSITKSFFRFFAIIEDKEVEIVFTDILAVSSLQGVEGLLYNGNIYVDSMTLKTQPRHLQGTSNSESQSRLITGYQIYNPPIPFNQRFMNVGVLIPYTTTMPLPLNYETFLSPILKSVTQYYLHNSENQTYMNFTLHPVFLNSNRYTTVELINAGDPYIDYSRYRFIAVIELTSTWGGGLATMVFQGNSPYYYPTNDGPLASAVPYIYTDSSQPNPNRFNENLIAHEIGHELTFWHPQVNPNVNFGFVSHASGLQEQSDCVNRGSTIVCRPFAYGDYLDVMGLGSGSFHYHQRAFFMGLSSISNVQSITGGVHALCDINHRPPVGCPQELLIQNPVGNNLALELRTATGPESYYSCPEGYFDGVLVRVVDREERGGIGNTLMRSALHSGDVIVPNSYTPINCGYTHTLLDYPIRPGQVMHSQLGDISVQSIGNLAGGGQRAMVNIDYAPAQCIEGSPYATVDSAVYLYSNNLWSFSGADHLVYVENNNVCNTGSETFSINVDVPSVPGASNSTLVIINNTEEAYVDLPIPVALTGLLGLYPFVLTVSKISNPSHSISLNGAFTLRPSYSPRIFGPFSVSNCIDRDPVPFTWENLGANFLSQSPNTGAVITPSPPIPGMPATFEVPDTCDVGYFKATDVVCGADTGLPRIENMAFLVVKECRFAINYRYAYCSAGTCLR